QDVAVEAAQTEAVEGGELRERGHERRIIGLAARPGHSIAPPFAAHPALRQNLLQSAPVPASQFVERAYDLSLLATARRAIARDRRHPSYASFKPAAPDGR